MSCKRPPDGWMCTREENHDGPCAPVLKLPLIDTDERAVTWIYLKDIDDEDLKFATYESIGGKRLLELCPFCGFSATVPVTKLRRENGMYQTTVACVSALCGANVFANAGNKADARAEAVRKWNDRRPHKERLKDRKRA
jgi:hypothetical protein